MNTKKSAPEKEIIPTEEHLSYGRKYSFYYVAAVIMITSVLIFQFLKEKPDSQDLYAAYFQPYHIVKDSIPADLKNLPQFKTAIKVYNLKNYASASMQFDALLRTSKDTDIAFYNAMSHLNNANFISAQAMIDRLKKEKSNYLADLHWYSALISLKQNNKQEVIIQLDSLKLVNSGYRRKAALAIVKQLKD